jgi:FMN phosphatase YigB (HAD superfamily)
VLLRQPITTTFFELHATLIEPAVLAACTVQQVGQIMAERYGGEAAQWTAAYQRMRDDWDSYHADLDFGGDDGLDQVYEGLYRTTRALFRLIQTPEPPREELQTLSRELPALMSLHCDAIRPDVREVITTLDAQGVRLGVITYGLESQSRALLQGGHIAPYFNAPVLGVDTLGQYTRDLLYYQRVAVRSGTPPDQCLIVDRSLTSLDSAHAAGMQTAWLTDREPAAASPDFVDVVLGGTLAPLLTFVNAPTAG